MSENIPTNIGDEAVKAKTGKTWSEWFKILDKADATKMSHKEIVAHLKEKFGVGSWWRQMVTVTYEQARGMREVHEKPEGFQISKSKTIAAPVSKLYKAWIDENVRERWMKDPSFTIRKKTANKNIRITWIDNSTTVEVMFYPKGDTKTQIVVQQSKLSDAKRAERMKTYWGENLEQLQKYFQD